jgi:trimeric autotransporter adhesin
VAALLFNTSGTENTAVGTDALVSNDTGSSNSAFGAFALFSNTIGGENTTNGYQALYNNTTGNENTAIGDSALFTNTSGGDNTAIGYHALFGNTGDLNTATGWSALSSNTTGAANTADGLSALLNNTTGSFNTAIGVTALQNNDIGSDNTAIGYKALQNNNTIAGEDNTAIGYQALLSNTAGPGNTAVGFGALMNNTIGNVNTAIGYNALPNSTGGLNIALGHDAGVFVTTASGVICIGSSGDNVDDTTWIGGIFGATPSGNSVQVFISPEGQLAAVSSSRRFKKEIKPMEKASDVILALKPVTFKYNHDKKGTPCFGLIAEEVAQVDPDLVVRDKNGEIFSVRYDAVNAMLLNEFLKEHKAFVEEHRTVQDLKATVAQQEKQIEALTAGLQKVSARLELNTSAPETVSNAR